MGKTAKKIFKEKREAKKKVRGARYYDEYHQNKKEKAVTNALRSGNVQELEKLYDGC